MHIFGPRWSPEQGLKGRLAGLIMAWYPLLFGPLGVLHACVTGESSLTPAVMDVVVFLLQQCAAPAINFLLDVSEEPSPM